MTGEGKEKKKKNKNIRNSKDNNETDEDNRRVKGARKWENFCNKNINKTNKFKRRRKTNSNYYHHNF